MKCDTRTTLILTKKEQETIESFVNIMQKDNSLLLGDVWEIMTGIADNRDRSFFFENQGYNVIITDR